MGALFLFLQYNEYSNGEFTIADSVFGSVFYMTTGLHALHVIAGVLFLINGLIMVVLFVSSGIPTGHGILFVLALSPD